MRSNLPRLFSAAGLFAAVALPSNGQACPSGGLVLNNFVLNAPALDPADFFGQSMANIGDLDGDGVEDLAVGATSDDDGAAGAGAVVAVAVALMACV